MTDRASIVERSISDLTIHAGPHRHETRIGPIFADRVLAPSLLAVLVSELERQGRTPRSVASATPVGGESGRFVFEPVVVGA